ncbi:hypothetical protein, partial [Neoaquamicrobium sediminum]|uniref:hypothetical protein n=1 Tax=Neoaquamicrobium sediminum TaxID=1849104 RepID=UPI004036F29F
HMPIAIAEYMRYGKGQACASATPDQHGGKSVRHSSHSKANLQIIFKLTLNLPLRRQKLQIFDLTLTALLYN